jgi:hypothetical protein
MSIEKLFETINKEINESQWSDIKEIIAPFVRDRLPKKAKKANKKIELSKAINDVIFNLAGSIHEADLSQSDVKQYIEDYKTDRILQLPLRHGINIFNHIDSKYISFAKSLYNRRPFGLGTPNAACGEGELMLLFLSPKVALLKKKGEGDLILDGKKVELKGLNPRLYGKISGNELGKRMEVIGKKFGVTPNDAKGNRKSYEPWDPAKKKSDHWQLEFNKLGRARSIEFVFESMNAAEIHISKENITKCFSGEKLNVAVLDSEIIKELFREEATSAKWDEMIFVGNNEIVNIISRDPADFNRKVDNGDIKAMKTFFRMFLPNKIAWYLSFSK